MSRLLLLVPLLAACNSKKEVTWYGDLEPIAAESCVRCHNAGGIGSFLDLTDADAAVAWSEAISSAVADGRMPPFPADGGACEPEGGFMHDPRLSEDQREMFVDWASAGAPLGERNGDAPPIPVIDTLDDASAELQAPSPVRVPPAAELSDDFVCLLLDPSTDQTVWLDAFEVVPDVAPVVHHVLVYTASRADALAKDAADGSADGTYPCFGGVEIPGANLVSGWIPGAAPLRFPEGSGTPLQPDEILVAQMHYHGLPEEQQDRSTLRVHWQTSEPERPAVINLYGNARNASQGLQPGPNDDAGVEFRIPAGTTGHVETSQHEIPLPDGIVGKPFMLAPHMHLVGTGMTVWLQHEDGSRECLVDVPRYDFDWQLFYFVDPTSEARTVRSGDSLVIECRYDNDVTNPALARALQEAGLDAPVDVTLGEGTLDEMCLVGVGAVPARE